MQNPIPVSCSAWYLCIDAPRAVLPENSGTRQYVDTHDKTQCTLKQKQIIYVYALLLQLFSSERASFQH